MKGLLESLSYRLVMRSCLPDSEVCGGFWWKCRVNSCDIGEECSWPKEQNIQVPEGRSTRFACGAPRRPLWRGWKRRGRKQGSFNPYSEGSWPYPLLDFRVLSSWIVRQHIWFFRSPSAWHFATTVLSN